MKLAVQLEASADRVELRTNHLFESVRLLVNGRLLHSSVLLTGPDHATSGACPGEADVQEQMDGPLVHSWSVLLDVGQRVVFRRRRPKWFARVRPSHYEVEVDGTVVERRVGF